MRCKAIETPYNQRKAIQPLSYKDKSKTPYKGVTIRFKAYRRKVIENEYNV